MALGRYLGTRWGLLIQLACLTEWVEMKSLETQMALGRYLGVQSGLMIRLACLTQSAEMESLEN